MALLVAAGSGSRRAGPAKEYRRLAGQPCSHMRSRGCAIPGSARSVVIGAGQSMHRDAVGRRAPAAPIRRRDAAAVGAQRPRRAGRRNGGIGQVLIHDAARPFLPAPVVDRLLDALDEADGAVPALAGQRHPGPRGRDAARPVPRDDLVRVQTPQAFRLERLRRAPTPAWPVGEATDDAQVARAAGSRWRSSPATRAGEADL